MNKELIFIDEAGFNLWLKRSRGRAPVGERAVRVMAGQRGANLTMAFTINSCHGIIHHNLLHGSMTVLLFDEFIQLLIQIIPNLSLIHI